MNESLPGNPHVSNDLHIYASGSSSANQANVAATLALAYEQRTATLVHALLSDSLVTDGQYEYLQAVVRGRLGLDGDA